MVHQVNHQMNQTSAFGALHQEMAVDHGLQFYEDPSL
jgi:hypothetical protein